jgi:hypothetical protein
MGWDAKQPRPLPFFLPYSPECVEEEFCELRVDGVLRSSTVVVVAQRFAPTFSVDGLLPVVESKHWGVATRESGGAGRHYEVEASGRSRRQSAASETIAGRTGRGGLVFRLLRGPSRGRWAMLQTAHTDSHEPPATVVAAVPISHAGFALRKTFLRSSPVGAVFAAQIYRPSASAPPPTIASLHARYWKAPRAEPRGFVRLARFPKKMGRAGTQGLAVSEGEEGRRGLRCLQ